MRHDLNALLEVAESCADAARTACLDHFRAPGLTVENKKADGFDPVTEADREAEAAMRHVLEAARPDDGIFGEEQAAKTSVSGLTWVLDPIDGTRAFMIGAPTWGVLVALNDGGAPLLGVIDQPFTGERFTGLVAARRALWSRGDAARQLAVQPCADLAAAKVATTVPELGTPDDAAGDGTDRPGDRGRSPAL